MTEFMIRFSGSKNTQFFLRLVYYPLWQYWQNFERVTRWRDDIIIVPNDSYAHKIWFGSLHDRIYDPIPWFQKYSVFPSARVLPFCQYCQNFEQATGWREGIIIDPNHSYGYKIWYGSLHDRIYDPIDWFQKYSVFPPARVLSPLAILENFRTGHEVAWRHNNWSESFLSS